MDIKKEVKAYVEHQKKLVILKYVRDCGCVNKTLKDFRIPKSIYYK